MVKARGQGGAAEERRELVVEIGESQSRVLVMKMGVGELGVNSCGFPVFRAFGLNCLKMFWGKRGVILILQTAFLLFLLIKPKLF